MLPRKLFLASASAVAVLCFSDVHCQAFNVISPGDPILAIDLDFTIGSSSPGGEQALNVLDGDSATKYLNFGVTDTGFIVTPTASSIVQSMVLTTANDAFERDPASYILYGTNDPITSTANGNGRAENWTEIAMGALALPDDRLTIGDPVGFANAVSFSSYKLIFPTVKAAANSMQIADVGFYSSMDGTGANILAVGNPIVPVRDVDPFPASNSPAAEGAENAIDRDVNTKYLNFGKENSGFIVTPSAGPTVINAFRLTTANDAEERDPASWELYGTNDTIVTENNGIGDEENWTLIDSGTLALPADRFTDSGDIAVNNTAGAFTSYRMIFPTVKDDPVANSMQIAEVALLAADQATLQVNRQTGEVVLNAIENVSFDSYELRSSTNGGLDAGAWNSLATSGSDPDDTWTVTSSASDSLAEEDAAGGADNGFTITAGNSYSFGDVWMTLPTIYEDLAITANGTNGFPVGIGVEFVGTEIPVGDYSGNGSVGIEDWPTFIAGYGGNYTGQTVAEAYFGGDLDGDFDSDIYDFQLFVAAAGGLSALFGQPVPEPSSMVLAVGVIGAVFGLRRFRASAASLVLAVVACLLLTSTAEAQTFTNVGGVPIGITIPADQQNETAFSGPANLFDDTYLDDPGAINDELFLLDYNDPDLTGDYLQYAGLGGAPKTVFFDYGSSVTANWFAYAQRSGGDPTADRVGMFEFWFSNTSFNDTVPTTAPNAVVKLEPTDPRLLDSALRPYSLSGSQSGRYVAMRLTISDISANQPVSNLGGHEFRLLSGPGDVVVQVNRATGDIVVSNNQAGAQAIEMKSYTIESASAALDASGFNGLRGDSGSFPAGNGTGNGWEIGGGSNSSRVAEAYYSSTSTLGAGTSGLSLGSAYNTLTLAEDLVFTWTNSSGDIFNGRVEYVGTAPDVLPGDYNDDGTVNLGDYTVWRDNLGASITLPNDATPGSVGMDDYNLWKLWFGTASMASGVAGTTNVPEPTSLAIVLMAGATLLLGRKRFGAR